MKALFFAEGGPGIGLGHLRRCAALAEGLGRRGWETSFLSCAPAARDWLAAHGQRLAPGVAPCSGRLPEADYRCDAFVLDSYAAANDEVAAKAKGKAGLIVAFDDQFNRHPVADVILSTGIIAAELPWPDRTGPTLLLGPAYHPLPSEYLAPVPERAVTDRVERVLLTLGGSGTAAQFESLAAAIQRAYSSARVDVAVGPFTEGGERLEALPRLRLHPAPATLRPLMLGCDLAVAASGQTLFELAATGTPGVAFCAADNQRENLLGTERAGCVLSAGSLADADFDAQLARALSRAADPSVRRRLREAGRALVDGQGPARIEAVLLRLLEARRARS